MDLVLPLKREYFDAIKAGSKPEEYRLRNPYWRRRLEGRTYDRVVLTLGYPPKGDDARRIVLPWRGYTERSITHPFFGTEPVDVYAIRLTEEAPAQPVDCPALTVRSNTYPFGNRVPVRVRMLRTVTADPMPAIGFAYLNGRMPPVAMIGQVLPAWTNSHGAICAVVDDGQKLGLKPGEFEVADWHQVSN